MNKELYIELLEKKVEDLEKALVTVFDKLIEKQKENEGLKQDFYKRGEQLDDEKERYGRLSDIIYDAEAKKKEERDLYEKYFGKESYLYKVTFHEWARLYEIKEKMEKLDN